MSVYQQFYAWRSEAVRLRLEVKFLRGLLAAQSIESLNVPEGVSHLPPQCVELVGLLVGCYPRYISRHQLDAALPGQDSVRERETNLIGVLISKCRNKLGKDTIENKPYAGYRATPKLLEMCGQNVANC